MDRTFGHTIAQRRKRKKLSLRRLAAMVSREDGKPISAPYLCDIEQGNRVPSLYVLRQLAAMLDMDEVALLGQARKADAIVREHLESYPADEEAIIRVVRAVESGQLNWHRLLESGAPEPV